MTIGRKIGGGFCAVLALAVVLGGWAIYAMHSGAKVAEEIAGDRMPRFMHWTQMQNDLLESAYYAAEYFDGGEAAQMEKANGFIRAYGESLEAVKGINAVIHYTQTATSLEKLEKDLAVYKNMMQADQGRYARSEEQVDAMMAAARNTLSGLESLSRSMTLELGRLLDAGDVAGARSHARALGGVNSLYAKVAGVYQDLLAAERNNDLEQYAKIRERVAAIESDAVALEDAIRRPESRAVMRQTLGAFRAFAANASNVASSLREFLEANRARYAHFMSMYDETTRMVEVTTVNSEKVTTAMSAHLERSTLVVAVLLLVVLALGAVVAFLITRGIVGPLTGAQRFAEQVAGGDLDQELAVHASDETGRLADALRAMLSALKTNIRAAQEKSAQAEAASKAAGEATARATEAARKAESAKREGMLAAAGQLERVAEIIGSASTELSARIEQSDRGASESAQRLQEAATAMNEMNATVQEVARNAGAASEASTETRHKAVAGQQVVSEVVSGIGRVQTTSIALRDDMIQLNARAQDINRIMGVISDIADQTNLLALNAAIEAARAGEAGRGFAVVADEVRKLAEKTMSSTQDVSNAIHAIQDSTAKSMASVDDAVERIGEVTELARQSGAALEEIVATVESTSDQVRAIATASEEQSAASEEINRSITEVNDMSRLTAEAMSEAAQAIADLAGQAHELTALIDHMKSA